MRRATNVSVAALKHHRDKARRVADKLKHRSLDVALLQCNAFCMTVLKTQQTSALSQVGREQLVSLGQCIGKLTHSGKFRLTIGALDVLGSHAKYKVK